MPCCERWLGKAKRAPIKPFTLRRPEGKRMKTLVCWETSYQASGCTEAQDEALQRKNMQNSDTLRVWLILAVRVQDNLGRSWHMHFHQRGS